MILLRKKLINYLRVIFRSDDFKWSLSFILMGFVWIGIASDFYRLIPSGTLEWMNRIYWLFNNNIWLNIPACTFLFYHFYKFSLHFIEGIRIYLFFAIAFIYLILYYQSPFDYAIIVWRIDYRFFLSALLGVVLLIMLYAPFVFYRHIIKRWSDYLKTLFIPDKNVKGFSSDCRNEKVDMSLPTEAYVNVIVKKLKKTDLGFGYDSFAIGITSEWGTGKTTFLNRLKDEIRSGISLDIVDFNPWMCQSAEQVTKDFFTTLRKNLSQRHPALSNPIKKYARQLRAITLPVFGNISIELDFNTSDKSLLEMKQNLSRKFSMLEEPVVVVIDDLDRLDSSEVFEVLRLIRNTADLSNMIYLVAYDKNYITKLLENKHISDPVAYLEKIFQLEIQLPLVSDDSVWTTLKKSLYQQLPNNTDISFIEDQKDLIKEILNSYRRAKRFARLFSLDYDYLKRESIAELNLKEKFLLDLLQMDDKEIYDILWNQPERLLLNEGGIWTYRQIETSKDGVPMKGDTIILEDGTKIKPTTNKLLACLWPGGDVKTEPYSIRYVENSAEYFTMKVQFSKKHVKNIVDSYSGKIDALIEQICSKVRPDIIIDVMIDYNKNTNLKEPQKENLILGALSAWYYCADLPYESYKKIIELVAKKDSLTVREWFERKLVQKECNYVRLFTILQHCEDYNLIKSMDARIFIELCMNHFVDNHYCSILDCIRFNKDNNFFLYEGLYQLHADNRKIAFNYLIHFYSQEEQKPTMEKYVKVRDYVVKDKFNGFKSLFEDDWKDYLVKIERDCIEPIKSSE